MDLEKILSEYLDDLLVDNNLLPRRKVNYITPPRGMMGMILTVKEDPRVKFKLELYPNETEEPHFKVTYQNVTCRFKIADCEPMKAEAKNGIPTQIKKIMKEIKQTWKDNEDVIKAAWKSSRPTSQHHGHQYIR